MSDSLWPHGLQHARPPCPSSTPSVYSNSCPLSWWCHPTISSSVIPFSSRLQSFPASGSFQMSQLFASGGQSIGVSASASVLPMNKIYMLYIDLLIYICFFWYKKAIFKKEYRGLPWCCQWLWFSVSSAGGVSSIPGWGTKIPHAARCSQNNNKIKNINKNESQV